MIRFTSFTNHGCWRTTDPVTYAVTSLSGCEGKGMKHSRDAPYHPQTQGKIERWHQTFKSPNIFEKLLPARWSWSPNLSLRRSVQPPALRRDSEQRHAVWRLLLYWQSHFTTKRKDQMKDTRSEPLTSQPARCIMKLTRWSEYSFNLDPFGANSQP